MACCGGKGDASPISRTRYLIGICVFLGAYLVIGLYALLLSLFRPRYRRLSRFYFTFFRDTLAGILRRDDILVDAEQGGRAGQGGSS